MGRLKTSESSQVSGTKKGRMVRRKVYTTEEFNSITPTFTITVRSFFLFSFETCTKVSRLCVNVEMKFFVNKLVVRNIIYIPKLFSFP